MFIGAAGLQLFAAQICGVFSLTPEAESLCIQAIRIVTLGYLFAGANIAFQGIFQALGFGIKSLLVSMLRLIIVTLPLAWRLAMAPNAANIVWFAFPIAEGCGLIAALFFMKSVSKARALHTKETIMPKTAQ